MEYGVMLRDHTNAKSVITTFRNTYSSVGNAVSWLVTDAGEIDYDELRPQYIATVYFLSGSLNISIYTHSE